ncbi:MAG: PDZ domain-containing protein [Fimbriimonadaceae bacterium]
MNVLAGSVATLLLSSATVAPDEIPFRIAEDAIIIDAVVNGREVSLMYDTGYTGYVVLNDKVNVGEPEGTVTVRDFARSFQADVVPLKSLKIGNHSFDTEGESVMLSPGVDYSFAYNTHVDGILGYGPMADEVMEINFEEQKLIFYPDDYEVTRFTPDNETTFLVPMLPKGMNSVQLQTKAPTGRSLYLGLDTGNAFYLTTHKDVLERVGLWEKGQEPAYMGASSIASGVVERFDLFVENAVIYGVTVPQSVWAIIDLPSSDAGHDGTVGFGFLKHFNTTIDPFTRRVWMENHTGRYSDDMYGDIGLTAVLNPEEERFVIVNVMPKSPAEEAGIEVGDELLSVDRRELLRVGFRELMHMLEGEAGSTVHIATSRNGQLLRYDIERKYLINGAEKLNEASSDQASAESDGQ